MAQGLGFYSGLLEGTKAMQSMDVQRQELSLQQRRVAQEEENSRESNLNRALERQQMLRSFEREDKIRSILEQSNANLGAATGESEEFDILANEYSNVGKSILGLDPKQGMEFIKESRIIRNAAADRKIKDLELQKTRADMQGEILYGIEDQNTLDAARESLARLGIDIPERYRDYNNPETKSWIKKTALRSKTVREAIKLQQADDRIRIQDENTQSQIEARRDRQMNADRNYALNREKIKTSKPQKQPTLMETGFQVELLKTDPTFKRLKDTEQLEAARDVIYLATALVAEGTAKSMQDGETLARQQILAAIDPESRTYVRENVSGSTELPKGEVGTRQNPAKIVTQAEYDSLPSGAVFINPDDNQLLVKP